MQDTDRKGKGDQGESNASADTQTPRRPRRRFTITLLVLVLLGLASALAVSGYHLFSLQTQAAGWREQERRITDLRENLRQELAAMREKQLQTQRHEQELEAQLEVLRQTTDALGKAVARSVATPLTSADWRLIEAEHQLHIANQRLILATDISGALVLMDNARRILIGISDPLLLPVRVELARETASLRTFNEPDIATVHEEISALGELVAHLPTKFSQTTPTRTEPQEDPDADNRSLDAWSELRTRLAGLVSIRTLDDSEQRPGVFESRYLRLNLELMLKQAQVAALNRKQAIYQRTLARAHDWTQHHFSTHHTDTSGFLERLQELAQKDIGVVKIPPVDGALKMLQEYREQRRPEGEGFR